MIRYALVIALLMPVAAQADDYQTYVPSTPSWIPAKPDTSVQDAWNQYQAEVQIQGVLDDWRRAQLTPAEQQMIDRDVQAAHEAAMDDKINAALMNSLIK